MNANIGFKMSEWTVLKWVVLQYQSQTAYILMSCVKYPITVGKLKKHKFELSTGFIPKMPLPGSPEILGKHSILPFLGNLSYSSSPKIAYKTCLMVGSPKCCVKKSLLVWVLFWMTKKDWFCFNSGRFERLFKPSKTGPRQRLSRTSSFGTKWVRIRSICFPEWMTTKINKFNCDRCTGERVLLNVIICWSYLR